MGDTYEAMVMVGGDGKEEERERLRAGGRNGIYGGLGGLGHGREGAADAQL